MAARATGGLPYNSGKRPLRILLLARSLGRGGAERQISQLACALHVAGQDVRVALFYGGGVFEQTLIDGRVPVIHLDKKGTWDVAGTAWRLIRTIRAYKPDVIYSFMLGPNILAACIKPFVRKARVIWGIRTAAADWRVYGRGAVIASRVERLLAPFVDLIICNSEAGRRTSLDRRFPDAKLIVIPNGIDTERFRPNEPARRATRMAWGIKDHEPLIGLVGRLDAHKGHELFFCAAGAVSLVLPSIRAICVGDGPEPYASNLKALGTALLGEKSITWLNAQDDMVAVYNALDVLVLCSTVEGFPNVLAEAMSCGTRVVTTPAGDAATILGDDRWVVQSGDCKHLAEVIVRCVQTPRYVLAKQHRTRICSHYSIPQTVSHFLRAAP